MEWREPGIIVGSRKHGETSLILEALTRDRGRHLGLVKGGRGRRMRPLLQTGNSVLLAWRARLDAHLGTYSVEPITERAASLMTSAVAMHGLQHIGNLVRLLAERDPHPRIYDAVNVIVDNLNDPALAAELIIRLEVLFLEELGVGLDLTKCAATGETQSLVYVSPKSGRAVSQEAGAPYHDRLMPLPPFLLHRTHDDAPDQDALAAGFALTHFFLRRHVYQPRGLEELTARDSFVETVLARLT